MMADHTGIMEISAYLHPIGEYLKAAMVPFWEDNGFRLIGFYITSIDIDGSTSDGAQILQSMANRSARDIEGFTYQQERTFDTMHAGAAGSGVMGIGLGMAMGQGIGQAVSATMGSTLMNATNTPLPSGGIPGLVAGGTNTADHSTASSSAVFCAKCGTKTSGAKFCPTCGKPYMPCPACGADNLDGAVKCVMCSRPLGLKCPKCGKPLAPDARFCPSCGENLKKACATCGTPVPTGTKFCPNCGAAL